MRIAYDKVGQDCHYPLDRAEVIRIVRCLGPEIERRISTIRFRYNSKTTQEGTTRRIGDSYQLTVNFCLKNSRTRVLNAKNKKYLSEIKRFGGTINAKAKEVLWSLPCARRYVTFVLLHEIGHVAYFERYLDPHSDNGSTKKEEDWCDDFSIRIMRRLGVI